MVEGKRVVLIDDLDRARNDLPPHHRPFAQGGRKGDPRQAPPFVSECYYGTDIDDKNNLIATHHTVDEIAKIIGVNSLGYLSTEDVVMPADNTGKRLLHGQLRRGYPGASR